MEDKYILSTNTFEDWRNYLLVNSFFFEVLIRDIRRKLGIPENGLGDIRAIMEWDRQKTSNLRIKLSKKSSGHKSGTRIVREALSLEDTIRREAYKPIWQAIEKFSDLNLSYSLLHPFVLGNTAISFPGSSKVLMITSPDDPIRETGIYIKYSPEIKLDEMTELMKQAHKASKTLFRMTHKSTQARGADGKLHTNNPESKIKQRKGRKPTDQQLNVYFAIEKYLLENYLEQPEAIKIQNVFDDLSGYLKMNPGTLRRQYYAILGNFRLPSILDTKQIS